MNVLSLFDGMSCGQIALNRAKIPYDNYYASEIDKFAIAVTQHNYPNTIQIGDVTKVSGYDLPKIDLLMGGSPCQGFSFAGKQLNFDDPRSKLFFEYARILDECREKNPNIKFLLENVKMKKDCQDIITEQLDVQPIEINSALVSAQNRKRLYFTNINGGIIPKPKDAGRYLKDILLSRENIKEIEVPSKERVEYIKRRVNKGWVKSLSNTIDTHKTPALTRVMYKTMKEFLYVDVDGYRFLDCVELERLQTVPDNYTYVPYRHRMMSKTQRRIMLGNGWTIDVIVHILNYLKEK